MNAHEGLPGNTSRVAVLLFLLMLKRRASSCSQERCVAELVVTGNLRSIVLLMFIMQVKRKCELVPPPTKEATHVTVHFTVLAAVFLSVDAVRYIRGTTLNVL